jgi:signal peptidase II
MTFEARHQVVALVVVAIVALDAVLKYWALGALSHGYTVQGLGGLLPLTLAFNTGIAFGLGLPSMGRWLIVGASFLIIIVLLRMLRDAHADDWWRSIAIGLVLAGAVGNLIDRLRWDRGVVDFIGPINLGFMYWPIFNIADMAITTGAIALALSLWREDVEAARAASPDESPAVANER